MRDLAGAVCLILKGGHEAKVVRNEEPVEHEFKFTADGDKARLAVLRCIGPGSDKDDKEVFAVEGRRLDICLPFWRAFRRLETSMRPDEYRTEWHHEFPQEKVREMGEIAGPNT